MFCGINNNPLRTLFYSVPDFGTRKNQYRFAWHTCRKPVQVFWYWFSVPVSGACVIDISIVADPGNLQWTNKDLLCFVFSFLLFVWPLMLLTMFHMNTKISHVFCCFTSGRTQTYSCYNCEQENTVLTSRPYFMWKNLYSTSLHWHHNQSRQFTY